jgi:hypothetical protein
MPPRRFSRHTFALAFTPDDEDEVLPCLGEAWPGRSTEFQLASREPFRFRELTDNRIVRAKEGDTVFTLAARHFAGMPRPAGLWWVICDFQPQPIIDPTVRLRPGALVVIPSARTVQEQIFAEGRRRESNVT